jgi:class 3 adenylate cyclase/pSer/pThr/pTyr-binding forkhead associated (FHA) protein
MSNPASVTQIISAGKGQNELMAELEKFRRTVVVMFTDIKGSTAYFEKYGDVAGLMMVHQCNDTLQKIVEAHKGRVIKFIGDAIMAVFEDPKESVSSAMEMQKALIVFNAPKPEQDHVFIRIGLNYGNGIVKSNDVFGDVVNVASRVESAAQPEQIVISDTLYEHVKNSGFKINGIGRFSLKGKEGDRDLYEVVWDETRKRAVVSHAKVQASEKASQVYPTFKLLHIKKDGTVGAEHVLKSKKLTMGRSQGEVQFPGDAQLAPLHARFFAEGNQLNVEDMSEGRGVYVRLIATYTLQNNDIIMMGRQVLKFVEKPEALAAAASTGTTMLDMSSLLQEPVAQFVRILPDGKEDEVRFPLLESEITFGRNKGTFIFPDDGFMSRSHAKVYQRGDSFFIEDMGSRNGTFVRVVGSAPVPQGSMVLAGGQLLKAATV